ncbi:MAG: hypothetical protein H6718_24790 [Polyangiaceae bacterium]|nr:hypothetical protein [Polyangiaceae bacterium]MCB9605209.1 hypothetical protein [Polyangiaceae bacterium]
MRLSAPTIFTIAFGILTVTFAGCAATSDNNKPLQQDCSAVTTCYDQCICAGNDSQVCLNTCSANGGTGNTGNGGTGNTANGGTGNTANGGTGNTANGGTGNTGNGGTGNTTSCDSAVEFNDPTCNACMMGSCCSEVMACFGTSTATELLPCGNLQQCLAQYCADAADDAAFQACAQQECSNFLTQEAVDALNAWGTCIESSCTAACGG